MSSHIVSRGLCQTAAHEDGEDKAGSDDDKCDDICHGIKDFLVMLQSAPCIEEKTGSEHQRGYDDIADTSCKEQPEAVNRSQNGNQPYFERDVVLP